MGEKVPLEVASWGVLALISTLIVTTYGICEFPYLWRGNWFLDSIQTIIEINATHFITRGRCLSSKGDKYLMEDSGEHCYRCLSIHEKHKNVLQFKETLCEKFETLENICSTLAGDAPLNSMFRADVKTKPTDCPFKHLPLAFSYNKGNGECNNPMSLVDACTDSSKLIFRYQACPDIKGSESSVEMLTCLGFWREGFLRYLIGIIYFPKTRKKEFRCFLYDKGMAADRTTFYNLAQSGDQSCSGLVSAVDGANVMILAPLPATKTKCRYPMWITDYPHWHTLDGKTSYYFFRKNGTLKITEDIHKHRRNPLRMLDLSLKIVCHSQVILNSTALIAIAHFTSECDTSYSCLGFFRRDLTIIEIMRSKVVHQTPEDVCAPEHFNAETSEYVTLIPLIPAKRPCPYSGKYVVNNQGGALDFSTHTILEKTFTKMVHGDQDIYGTSEGSLSISSEPMTSTSHANASNTTTPKHFSNIPTTHPSFTSSTTVHTANCSAGLYKQIEVGCSLSGESLQFIHNCNRQYNTMYFCHGNWIERNISFLIVSPVSRKSLEPRHYCFMWKPLAGEHRKQKNVTGLQNIELFVSAATTNCHRTITPGLSGALTFNLSVMEFCEKANKMPPGNQGRSIVVPTMLFLLVFPSLVYAAR